MDDSQPETKPAAPQKHILRDILGLVVFVVSVIAGAFLLNTYIFQSFNVYGASMQPTLETNDRLVINKIPVTWKAIRGEPYIPPRGQVIVLENPLLSAGQEEQYLVKRVIGLPGERVVVENGSITVFNRGAPGGFNPDADYPNVQQPTEGKADTVVPDGEVFVAGDNRIGNNSLDSRDGLGTVPVELIAGPVYVRVFPFSDFRFF